MTTGLYLSAMSQNSGKSLVALGLADSLIKRADRVGFFRPVFDGATIADDPMARLIREHFSTDRRAGRRRSLHDRRTRTHRRRRHRRNLRTRGLRLREGRCKQRRRNR